MEILHVLGTGNAMATRCFNTCAVMELDGDYFMIDCGGGNGILRQLEQAGIDANKVHHIFLSHAHCDHLLGVVWMIRTAAAGALAGKYDGNLYVYCHAELAQAVKTMCCLTLQKKLTDLFDQRIFIVPVAHGEIRTILARTITFFDIRSTKALQYGFVMEQQDGGKLAFMGDEPINPACEAYAKNARWLLCEAFCLQAQAQQFKPYEKHHGTVADAARLAAHLGVENLLLWHTEQSDLQHRKQRYIQEARAFYNGNIFVPDDLDKVPLICLPNSKKGKEMELQIKLGRPCDVDALETFYRAVCDHLAVTSNYPGWQKDVYPAREDAQQGVDTETLYIAWDREKIAGTFILNHEPEQEPTRGAWAVQAADHEVFVVHTCAVHPDYRGCGVGRALLAFADTRAREKKVKAIRLDVYEKNTPAIALYERCGYRYVDTVDLGLGAYGLEKFRLYEKLVQL